MIKFSLGILLCLQAALAQQAPILDIVTHHDYVPLGAVPTSPTDVVLPTGGSLRVIITSFWFVNTNASTKVTVTVSCKTGATVLVKAKIGSVDDGGNNIPVQFSADGVSCPGGITWVADVSGLNGYITVRF